MNVGKKRTHTGAKPSATPNRSPSVEDLLGMVDLEPISSARVRPAASETYAATVPRVGTLSGFDPKGNPLIRFPGASQSKGRSARSTLPVTSSDLGREALVFFENGNPALPIITGLLEAVGGASADAWEKTTGGPLGKSAAKKTAAKASLPVPEKLVFEAGKELVLKCGPASITLTKDGRIVIRGADVLTRSSGSNRIKGGSVHIN